ncbi:unnamed protein product, partial [Choristocarpus tenellus]
MYLMSSSHFMSMYICMYVLCFFSPSDCVLSRQQGLSKTGKRIEDPQIVAWANSKVNGSKIRNFSDPSLTTGVFLLKVCHGINSMVVNWDLVTLNPEGDDEKANNAKYAISVARKLGALVFVVAEDIVQVQPRMIMLFCASLWQCDNERSLQSGNPDEAGTTGNPSTPPKLTPTGLADEKGVPQAAATRAAPPPASPAKRWGTVQTHVPVGSSITKPPAKMGFVNPLPVSRGGGFPQSPER